MESFSSRLTELRIEKNLSQVQLSKELNEKISQAAINLWEQGKRMPRLDSVILLANYFKVSVGYMAGVED